MSNINMDEKGPLTVSDPEIGSITKSDSELSEPKIESTLEQVSRQVAVAAPAWEVRLAKESVKQFASPLDDPAHRQLFATAKEAFDYTLKTYPSQIELARVRNQPLSEADMKEVVVSPKRRLEDFYPAGTDVQGMQRRVQVGAEVEQILAGLRQTGYRPNEQLRQMAAPESETIAKIPHLSTEDLLKLGHEAYMAGKHGISRKCRIELNKRGAQATW